MGFRLSNYKHGIVAAILLTLFTGYALLDVFVIPHAYRDAVAAAPTISVVEDSGKQSGDGDGQADADGQTDIDGQTDGDVQADADGFDTTYTEPVITDPSYRDANIEVTLTEYRVNDTDVYVADVKVASPKYLFTAFAKDTYGRNVKEATSQTASRVDAILAVNGDFYGSRTKGYVLRNGTLYRQASSDNEDLVLYGKNVLVAEDNSINAEVIMKILETRGVHSELARDGQEVVDMFLKRGPYHYQAILMDMMMPLMDGQSAARAIRESGAADAREIPILALTADTYGDIEQRCMSAGMDGYLRKPIDTDELFRVLVREFDKE